MALSHTYDDLDEFLADAGDALVALEEAEAELAPPADLAQADRYLRQYARLQRQADGIREVAGAERERIELWEAHRLDVIGRQQAWFADALTMFHRAVIADDPRAKSIDLPNGKLVSRAQQPEWRFDDEDAFLAWAAQGHDDLVAIPPPPAARPDKAAVKKAAIFVSGPDPEPGTEVGAFTEDTGEQIPGVTVVIRDRKFDVEVPT